MKHDYKSTHETMPYIFGTPESPAYERSKTNLLNWYDHNYSTISHALAMMQKLEEPSSNMVLAALKTDDCVLHLLPNQIKEVFKAMLEQAEKEIS